MNVEVAWSTNENIGWKARISAINQIELGISNGSNGARSVSKRDGFRVVIPVMLVVIDVSGESYRNFSSEIRARVIFIININF